MRFIDIGVVDDVLLHTLMSDPDPQPRVQAVYAVSFRVPTGSLISGLEDSLRDTSRAVRSSALQVLWRNHFRFPSSITAVKELSYNDPDPELRKQALTLLENLSQK